MALLVLFAALLLKTALQAVGQSAGAPPTPPADFLSIDCGLEGSAYNDSATGIAYVPDGQYVDSGENHRIAGDKATTKTDLRTLQSFPSGLRNCYTLPTRTGRKYLVRLLFFYGDYDGKDSASTLRFDLHLGPYPWVTVDKAGDQVYEAVFMAWARWTPVCLINTGGGTPFVSRVDLRPLGDALYPEVMANQSMAMYLRRSMGDNANYITRYPDDPYDRYWWQMWSNTTWKNISTTSNVQKDSSYAEPLPVLQTAVETSDNKTTLSITWEDKTPRCHDLKLLMHFADFQKSQLRQFNVSFLDGKPYQHSPAYLTSETLYNTGWSKATDDGKYYINLVPTAASKLPPMINALEIYTLISHDSPSTFQPDYETIMAIKLEYGIKKNWMGDPCFPVKFVWEGVKCSSADNNTARIISLDLSNSNLHGAISTNFTLLTALQYLNLSCNQLNGSVPESLRKNNTASFVFSYDSDGNMCNNPKLTPVSTGKKSNRTIILAISVAVPVMVIAVLVSVFFIWRQKRKPNLSTDDPPRIQPELNDDPEIKKNHGGALQMVENRQFTYHELEKVTNKFQRLIGQGGFGPVYYGHLEDYTEVAVKMRSESSSHGLNEFFAEVQSLTKVHHRNLVSLVGYCWDKEHLALVYEYMVRGSLCDQLRGNNAATETMTWRTRVGVAVEAAQGLDYLHKGCSLPIIHRDVKTSNILLGQNLQAKIADFGLSKTYLSETQTHISVTAAGTAGYIDPEYYQTGRLTESSDVYSFGIVLLEIATGEPPIVPGQGHIVQNVKKKIGSGNIGLIVDARLRGAYDVSSMWKVVDIALLCTTDVAAQRPTMAVVVTQLKESLALEEARVNSGFMGSTSTMSDTTYSMSTFSPLAR